MKIISWNTNGLRATVKQGYFESLFKDYDADIVCFQETKCEPEQLPDQVRTMPGYYSYFSHSKGKKGYSGVAVYSKVAPQSVVPGIGIPEFDDEGRTLVCYFDTPLTKGINKWILINTYFPNGGGGPVRLDYKLRFYDAFLEFIDRKKKEGYAIIFTGDVNTAHEAIDLARPQANENNTGFLPIERAWMDEVVAHGYVDTFRTLSPSKVLYSYWDQKTGARDRNVGWRIDYFFVTPEIMKSVKDSTMLTDYYGSDHCPIVLEVK